MKAGYIEEVSARDAAVHGLSTDEPFALLPFVARYFRVVSEGQRKRTAKKRYRIKVHLGRLDHNQVTSLGTAWLIGVL